MYTSLLYSSYFPVKSISGPVVVSIVPPVDSFELDADGSVSFSKLDSSTLVKGGEEQEDLSSLKMSTKTAHKSRTAIHGCKRITTHSSTFA